jgi:hypothetical protein
VTHGGTAAATASPRITRLRNVAGGPHTGRGAQVPQVVFVTLLHSRLRIGSLSSPSGWIVWSVVSPLPIQPWYLLPPLSLLSSHSQVLSHLGSLIPELLGSLSSLPSPVSVKTADGTPLLVVSHGTLCTPYFHVSFVSHVPQLHLQLFSIGQISNHGCRVILDSIFCSIHDRRTGTLVGSS